MRLLSLFLCLMCSGCLFQAEESGRPTLILISFDGFRWDYPEKIPLPNLQELIRTGVRARALVPVFPTKTFPNHYTLVTGLYPSHHGILFNVIYDPSFRAVFQLGDREEVEKGRWWGGEPIWVTVGKQGGRSATFFWPGSEAPIQGIRPHYWRRFDASVDPRERVEQALQWLSLPPSKRPSLITLYFEQVDDAGHDFGPDSPQLLRALQQVDRCLGQLLTGLSALGLREKVHLVVVSDHGMIPLPERQVLFLEDVLDLGRMRILEAGVLLQIFPEESSLEETYRLLEGWSPHLQVFRPGKTPPRWKLGEHPRLPPILGVAAPGWRVLARRPPPAVPPLRGDHGYDNLDPRMHGIFIASGPRFRRGLLTGPVEAVDVYELLCEILQVRPAPNDGNPQALRHLLRKVGAVAGAGKEREVP